MNERVVLVTGGAGFIGSHTCKALARAGYCPVTFDNLSTGHAWAVKWGPLERGDVNDRLRLDAVILRYRPSAIVHFAASAYVGESVLDPGRYFRNNVAGSLTLLEAARDHGIHQFVFSSTCATYGTPKHLPMTEETHQAPINPYGASKLMVERMLADFGAAHGLRSVILRYFNAAGCDPDGEIGEVHDPETHLIPLALHAASGQQAQLTVFGADYPTKDGTCVRDYVHVCDLAQAHLKALDALATGVCSEVLNLGNGAGFSVRDVIASVERVTGRPVPTHYGARREGDPPVLIADASRAQSVLGWVPVYPDLDVIVRSAWDWHQKATPSPTLETQDAAR